MDLDYLWRVFWQRPALQRAFLALTTGIFLACAAQVSGS